MRRFGNALIVIGVALTARPAFGQADVRATEWSHGTSLVGVAGIATDSARTGAVTGGSVGWNITPALSIEGAGVWTDFGGGTDAFSGAIKLRSRIGRPGGVFPFVQAGVGLHRAAFARGEVDVPNFYARRMAAAPASIAGTTTFTDPTVVAGGGLNIDVSRHFALRPGAEVTVVLRDGRALALTSIAVGVVYRFEDHPVTPSGRR